MNWSGRPGSNRRHPAWEDSIAFIYSNVRKLKSIEMDANGFKRFLTAGTK